MCFNFAYVTPPPPISFCNQNDPPLPLEYTPGECAGPDVPIESVALVFASFVEGEPGDLAGGEIPDGHWVVDGAEIYIESLDWSIRSDTDQSSVLAMGTVVYQDDTFHFDAQTEVNLVAGGLAFSTAYPISFAAQPRLSSEQPGRLNPEVTCGELPGGRNVRYEVQDGRLRVSAPARIGPVSVKIVVDLAPVVAE